MEKIKEMPAEKLMAEIAKAKRFIAEILEREGPRVGPRKVALHRMAEPYLAELLAELIRRREARRVRV